MTLKHLQLLRNIGQFDSVDAGAQLPLAKLALIYAENGRGKTTLAAILRSAGTNEPHHVSERQRLGAQHLPHVVLGMAGSRVVYQNGTWSAALPDVVVFDDAFVATNICSGIEVEVEHRQKLHELILGAQGVALNTALQGHVARIEQHNRALKLLEANIPAATRGSLSAEAFCALPVPSNIDALITEIERQLSAARASDAIRQRAGFAPLALPDFDVAATNAVLSRTLADLETRAAARVRAHLQRLGSGGEAWVGDGMGRIAGASENQGHDTCPFCAQDLDGSPLIRHYQAYFSAAYETLKATINDVGREISKAHGGDIPAAFERTVRVAVETRSFWKEFTDIPDAEVDTAAFLRTWSAAREAVLVTLRSKASAPLEASALPPETLELVDAYRAEHEAIATRFALLQACNAAIALVKERAAGANVATLDGSLVRLKAVKARHSEPIAASCQAYLTEKASKTETERLRTDTREALDNYRQSIFPAYEVAINAYLLKFNAGFQLSSVSSVNNRGGSACTYNVLINNIPVSLTAASGPSFRNTLSAGDRNTLALAFFFASLDQCPNLAQKIVVIDDPMTSLDEHRSLTTVQELRAMQDRVSQLLVLSHSKPFLCALWDGADRVARSAMLVRREGAGSTLEAWDVRQDSITEHDRRHERVSAYIQASNRATERQVAADLRPILEAFMRVAYPAAFPPGTLLGSFIGVCQQRAGSPNQILKSADIGEVRSLLDYANRFHHDTNPAYETEAINDQELVSYATRTLRLASRA
ncbi:AAA family ATPase [Novosphingopyxis sp.]|uniref:AAA family ATPase n=1 Tax=Novosphingopyxis sp. TaxID=2709690 RepID=UPI003B592525